MKKLPYILIALMLASCGDIKLPNGGGGQDSTVVVIDTTFTDRSDLIQSAEWTHVQPRDSSFYYVITDITTNANVYDVRFTAGDKLLNRQLGYNYTSDATFRTYRDTLKSDYADGGDGTAWNDATNADPSVKDNSVELTFPESTGAWLTGNNLTHFVLFDAASAGNYVGGGALDTPRSITAQGETLKFGTGELNIELS